MLASWVAMLSAGIRVEGFLWLTMNDVSVCILSATPPHPPPHTHTHTTTTTTTTTTHTHTHTHTRMHTRAHASSSPCTHKRAFAGGLVNTNATHQRRG